MAASDKRERLRRLILALLFASTVINYVDRQTLAVLLPVLRKTLDLSSAHYGAITMAFLVAYTVGQIPAGVWLDRVGARIAFSVFVASWSVAALLQGFAAGALSFGVIRSLLGLAEAGNWPAGAKAIAVWFPQERRGLGMAFFDGGSAVGAIAAPPLVAFIAIRWGWRVAFVGTGLLGFFWLAAWLWIYHSPEAHPWLSPADRTALVHESGSSDTRSQSFTRVIREITGFRQLWGLMATRMLATPVWWFYVFWLPDYLSRGRGFSLKQIGLYAWIPFLTADLGKFVGGSASDALLKAGRTATFSRKAVMVTAAFFMMSGMLVVGAANAASALMWVCLATFGFGMWSANILALHADIFPASAMGGAVGLTGAAASLGGAFLTFAIGEVVDKVGYTPVFFVVGLLAVTACAALFGLLGRVEPIQLRS